MTISGGTLDVSGFANAVASLNVTSGVLNLGVGNPLNSSGSVSLAGAVNISGSVSDTTGLYALATGSSMTASSPTYYLALTGAASNDFLAPAISGNTLELQHKANQTLTGAPATINIITGATTTVSATLTNTAPASSSNLNVGLSDNGSTGGTLSGFTGTGPVSANNGTLTVGATFTAGAVGTGKTWSLGNSDPNAETSGVSANRRRQYLQPFHALAERVECQFRLRSSV